MDYVKKSWLKETIHFESDHGISYRYEIFQRGDGTGFYAMSFRLVQLSPGSGLNGWIYNGSETISLKNITHISHAESEVTEHFKTHYKNT